MTNISLVSIFCYHFTSLKDREIYSRVWETRKIFFTLNSAPLITNTYFFNPYRVFWIYNYWRIIFCLFLVEKIIFVKIMKLQWKIYNEKSLTYIMSLVSFYISWKHQATRVPPMFSSDKWVAQNGLSTYFLYVFSRWGN